MLRNKFLSKTKSLRQVKNENISKIYITPDLSFQERLHQKSLRSELHRRRTAGETNLIIRKGQIEGSDTSQNFVRDFEIPDFSIGFQISNF